MNIEQHVLRKRKYSFLPFFVGCMYLFMYIPIIVLVIFSFNSNPFSYEWHRGTLHWYCELFSSVEVWEALKNSLIVAGSSVFLSLVIGVFFVCFASRQYSSVLIMLFYMVLAIPEIVLAVGMLSFFSLTAVGLGMTTLITGHTLIGLGYTIPILYNQFHEIDAQLIEVSLDLGASRMQTFFIVILPLMSPALIAAGLLVFTVSLDDFVFSFFCNGPSVQTLPVYIFSLIRSGATPMVNALSTLLLVVSSCIVFIYSIFVSKKNGALQ